MTRTCIRLTFAVVLLLSRATLVSGSDSGLDFDKHPDLTGTSLAGVQALYLSSTPRALQQFEPFPEAGTCSVTPMSCNTTISGSLSTSRRSS